MMHTARAALALVSLAGWLLSANAVRRDRRIVDTAEAGNAMSEASHGFVGHETITGISAGKTFRQTRGWMHFSMRTFDDTPVTVSCTFLSTDSTSHTFDVIVEDSLVATRTISPIALALQTNIDIAVPFVLTKGRSGIAVIVRARDGITPALRELRTVQDHNEIQ